MCAVAGCSSLAPPTPIADIEFSADDLGQVAVTACIGESSDVDDDAPMPCLHRAGDGVRAIVAARAVALSYAGRESGYEGVIEDAVSPGEALRLEHERDDLDRISTASLPDAFAITDITVTETGVVASWTRSATADDTVWTYRYQCPAEDGQANGPAGGLADWQSIFAESVTISFDELDVPENVECALTLQVAQRQPGAPDEGYGEASSVRGVQIRTATIPVRRPVTMES